MWFFAPSARSSHAVKVNSDAHLCYTKPVCTQPPQLSSVFCLTTRAKLLSVSNMSDEDTPHKETAAPPEISGGGVRLGPGLAKWLHDLWPDLLLVGKRNGIAGAPSVNKAARMALEDLREHLTALDAATPGGREARRKLIAETGSIFAAPAPTNTDGEP